MKYSEKYFLLNKASDFEGGFAQNVVWDHVGLHLINPQNGERGVFFSPLLDCLEQEMVWHRGLIESKSLGDASILFSFYASDSSYVTDLKGKVWQLSEYLSNAEVPVREKEQVLRPFLVRKVQNPEDLLLHDVKGRYLWFEIQLFGQGEHSPAVQRIQLSFPKRSWIQYLPEIYQNSDTDFLDRYLGIFQSLYDDLDRSIRNISSYLEIETTEKAFLDWLAVWLGIEGGYLWEEEKLRYLLRHAMELYSIKGTVESLKQIVELATGERPYVVEQYQIQPFRKDVAQMRLLGHLYGEDQNVVTVCLPPHVTSSNRMYQTLLKLIETVKPVEMEINLVLLKPYLFLDGYSYMGINSILGQYQPMQLDGSSAVPLTTIGQAEERKEST